MVPKMASNQPIILNKNAYNQNVVSLLWCPHTDSNRGPTDYKLHVPYFHRIA